MKNIPGSTWNFRARITSIEINVPRMVEEMQPVIIELVISIKNLKSVFSCDWNDVNFWSKDEACFSDWLDLWYTKRSDFGFCFKEGRIYPKINEMTPDKRPAQIDCICSMIKFLLMIVCWASNVSNFPMTWYQCLMRLWINPSPIFA